MIVTGAPDAPWTMLGDQVSSTCAKTRAGHAATMSASSESVITIQL